MLFELKHVQSKGFKCICKAQIHVYKSMYCKMSKQVLEQYHGDAFYRRMQD